MFHVLIGRKAIIPGGFFFFHLLCKQVIITRVCVLGGKKKSSDVLLSLISSTKKYCCDFSGPCREDEANCTVTPQDCCREYASQVILNSVG